MYGPLLGQVPGLLLLSTAVWAISHQESTYSAANAPGDRILPSKDAARRNAHKIFNSIHSATRQWGSSIDHNGLSFFRVTVPQGSYFFHGARTPDRPVGFEWLAFEVEHAYNFAASWEPGHGPHQLEIEGLEGFHSIHHAPHGMKALLVQSDSQQQPLLQTSDDKGPPERRPPPFDSPSGPRRGYLHTYQAARPLNILYVDGMSAAKSDYGTMDSQDFVLLGKDPGDIGGEPANGLWEEMQRAAGLCQLADEWERAGGIRVDGFMRMEAGFEIIYCRFEQGGGLDLVSVDTSAFSNETGWVNRQTQTFEWIRATSLRYNGFSRGRINTDWSHMVSAYFYDVNTTNPNVSKSNLPRLVNTSEEERNAVRLQVQQIFRSETLRSSSAIDWQGAVDFLVSRYSDRLELLSSGDLVLDDMRSVVNFLLLPYVDFGITNATPSLERCRAKGLEAILKRMSSWTDQDSLIYVAIDAVSQEICSTLIDMWEIAGSEKASKTELLSIVRHLKSRLAWNAWRECGRCTSPQDICFAAMFPFGDVDDHNAPRCKNSTEIGVGYWRRGRPPPPL